MRTKPRYEPTAADRNTVISMAACGFSHEQIARCIGSKGIDDKTLRKHFRRELDTAMDQANAAVANKAFQLASTGAVPALTIFWLKTRLGWKETDRHELTGEGGGAISVTMLDEIIKRGRARD